MLPNEIYGALNEANEAGNFHWSIFVVDKEDSESVGWKIHASQGEIDIWRFESMRWNGPKEHNALAFVKIGSIMEGLDVNHLVEYVKDIPMAVPEERKAFDSQFSSRVWFREAIRIFNDSQMFVYCSELQLEDLIREVMIQGALAENQTRGPQRPMITVSMVARPWPDDAY
ncbi:hypothetical protein BJ165DRAFT_1405448 [Panaeolus papilionaceus]|nr:hypothetical protein BJ165DRAFT_1405448 [Panaeolus papilionaceus]